MIDQYKVAGQKTDFASNVAIQLIFQGRPDDWWNRGERRLPLLSHQPLSKRGLSSEKHAVPTAVYYYGASSDEYRNVMAPYLVQWTAIQEAKKRGCETYDFLGVAPPFDGAQDLRDDVVDHPWAGVTSFKKKFGGEGVEFSEPFDLVLRPLVYSAYKLFS